MKTYICQFPLGIVFLLHVATDADVVMKIEQDIIELAKPLEISCEIQNDTLNGNRIWIGGKNSSLLSFNGKPSNKDKYQEHRLSDRKYKLTIKYITEADINSPYGCRFGLQSADIYLDAVDHNFRHLPTENMIDKKYVINEQNYSISVKFHDVFPVPYCAVEPQSKNLTNVNETQNGLLYDVQFSDQSEKPYHLCDHPVHIECYFGKTEYPIEINHDISCNRPTEGNILLSVRLSLSALIVNIVTIVLVVLCLIRRRRIRQLRNRRYLETEGQSFSVCIASLDKPERFLPSSKEEEFKLTISHSTNITN